MVGMLLPSSPLILDRSGARPRFCEVTRIATIRGCVGVREHSDPLIANFERSEHVGVVVCRHCGTDVTAALHLDDWEERLEPAVPALPSPNARGNELRSIVADGLDGVRVTLAEKRPLKAREYADALAWDALAAIAAGCDDPAGLARDLAVLRAEVSAAQR